MSGVLACPHCGGAIVVSADAPADRPRQGQQRPRPRQGQQRPPSCDVCGEPVNQRRDGSWFRTCIRCG